MVAMTRPSLLLLILGLGIVVLLVWHAGPLLVFGMLRQVGWSFPAVAAVYAGHVGLRAVALWRAILIGHVSYGEVLRVRLYGEAVEMLTFTGPFLAEPAKGWLLTRRGLSATHAVAAVATEYLLYTIVSSWLAATAVFLLLARGLLPHAIRPGAAVILGITIAFNAAFVFAAVSGIGLIVPIVRIARPVIGSRRTKRMAYEIGRVEELLIAFLHANPARLVEVLAVEAIAQGLLMLEIGIVSAALGLPWSRTDPLILEGGVKFIGVIFSFVPGQVGISEGVYALLFGAIGLPAAAGLTLALVRRLRSLPVAAAGVIGISMLGNR
jgi:hypothetical protein